MMRAKMETILFMLHLRNNRLFAILFMLCLSVSAFAQKYSGGVVDKTIAVIGNEMIMLSDIEEEVRLMKAQGMMSDRNARCELLEKMMEAKLFLMQSRLDSLEVKNDMVESEMKSRIDQIRTSLGGDEQVEEYFGQPIYKLRQQWRETIEEQSLIQQMQQKVSSNMPELTPYDVKEYINRTDSIDLPVVPIKYQLSQICVYPDREAANIAVKERLLAIRERIINGEKFSTLARIYSQDPGRYERV